MTSSVGKERSGSFLMRHLFHPRSWQGANITISHPEGLIVEVSGNRSGRSQHKVQSKAMQSSVANCRLCWKLTATGLSNVVWSACATSSDPSSKTVSLVKISLLRSLNFTQVTLHIHDVGHDGFVRKQQKSYPRVHDQRWIEDRTN